MTVAAIAVCITLAPLAQAVAVTYASAVSTSELSARQSPPLVSISGGTAFTEAFSADGASARVHIETFIPAPGYQTLHHTYGTAGEVNMSHQRRTNVYSKCWWDFPFSGSNIGNLDLTCKTR